MVEHIEVSESLVKGKDSPSPLHQLPQLTCHLKAWCNVAGGKGLSGQGFTPEPEVFCQQIFYTT